jgi:predicted RNA-binding protein YlqC (UPF0109 family)
MEPIQVIAEAVTNIVKLMVDKPEDVSVEVVCVPGGMVLRYLVAPGDVGKLIGAQGRNARSLRVIIAAIGMGAKLRINLDIPG